MKIVGFASLVSIQEYFGIEVDVVLAVAEQRVMQSSVEDARILENELRMVRPD